MEDMVASSAHPGILRRFSHTAVGSLPPPLCTGMVLSDKLLTNGHASNASISTTSAPVVPLVILLMKIRTLALRMDASRRVISAHQIPVNVLAACLVLSLMRISIPA